MKGQAMRRTGNAVAVIGGPGVLAALAAGLAVSGLAMIRRATV